MNEEGKQPQPMREREYRKLFGLEIYLTPVFVISSIAIVVFIIGSLIFQKGATELFSNLQSLAYHQPRLVVHDLYQSCFSVLSGRGVFATRKSTSRRYRRKTRILLSNLACHDLSRQA